MYVCSCGYTYIMYYLSKFILILQLSTRLWTYSNSYSIFKVFIKILIYREPSKNTPAMQSEVEGSSCEICLCNSFNNTVCSSKHEQSSQVCPQPLPASRNSGISLCSTLSPISLLSHYSSFHIRNPLVSSSKTLSGTWVKAISVAQTYSINKRMSAVL